MKLKGIRDRIMAWWYLRGLQKKHPQIKQRFICIYEGCDHTVSTLRFLLIGCECGMHSWYRRRGF